jgi:CheY-like chemotaxis protein
MRSKVNICYIDDSAEDTYLFKRLCEDLPVNLKTFGCIDEVSGDFDFIFTDLYMPRYCGIVALETLKRLFSVPIIAVSGLGASSLGEQISEGYKQLSILKDYIRKSELSKERIMEVIQ